MNQLLSGVVCFFIFINFIHAQHTINSNIVAPNFVNTELPNFRHQSSQVLIDRQADIVRSRFATLNFDHQLPDIITLNCFADATFIAVKQRTESQLNRIESTIYQIQGSTFGYAIITVSDQQLFAKIQDEQGRVFIISPEKKEVYAIAEIDASLADEGTVCADFSTQQWKENAAINRKNSTSICEETTQVCANVTVDLLVVYTDDVTDLYNSTVSVENAIANAIAEANQALLNSGVVHQFQLVHSEEVDYEETQDLEQDIIRLENGTDGYLDNIPSLRNTYKADLVAMIVRNGNGCGIGHVNTNPNQYDLTRAFSVTKVDCMISNLSFTHELGHNLGLQHDWHVNQDINPCNFAHGYVNEAGNGGTAEQRWRTIMAYQRQCVDWGYFTCTRLPYFSNPEVDYNSDPMGRTHDHPRPADGAFILNRSMCQVADFKKDGAPQPNLTTQPNSPTLTIEDPIITIQTTIENNGLVAADATEIHFYLSDNTFISESDFLLTIQQIPVLDAGLTSTHNFSFNVSDLDIPSGVYYVAYIIDNQNVVIENTETDNVFYFNEPQLTINNIYCEGQLTLTAPIDQFSDGSLEKRYNNNSSCYWVINPPEGDFIELTFTDFEVEEFYDRVNVYDGSTIAAPLIGSYHQGNPPPAIIPSSGSTMTVHFLTDDSVVKAGWTATYTTKDNDDDALPLELLDFTVKQQSQAVIIEWQTAHEIGIHHYEVERSEDGKNWQTIAQQKATQQGYYHISDALDAPVFKDNMTIYYRLKIVEQTDIMHYSPIRNLLINNPLNHFSIFPNPASELLTIQTNHSAFSTIQLIDMNGKIVKKWSANTARSLSKIYFNTMGLNAGVYWLRIFDERQQMSVQKIIIAK